MKRLIFSSTHFLEYSKIFYIVSSNFKHFKFGLISHSPKKIPFKQSLKLVTANLEFSNNPPYE